MAAPVKNTCPDIDKLIRKLESIASTAKDGMKKYRNEDDDAYELFKNCEWDIDSIIDGLESLRKSNSELRNYGESLECELHDAADTIYNLELEIEKLREQMPPIAIHD